MMAAMNVKMPAIEEVMERGLSGNDDELASIFADARTGDAINYYPLRL
jgi:hypothetical protein